MAPSYSLRATSIAMVILVVLPSATAIGSSTSAIGCSMIAIGDSMRATEATAYGGSMIAHAQRSSDTNGATRSMSTEAPPPSVRRAIGGSKGPIGGPTGPIGGSTSPIGGSTSPIGGSTRAIGGPKRAIGGPKRAISGAMRAIGGAMRAIGGSTSPIGGPTRAIGGSTGLIGGPMRGTGATAYGGSMLAHAQRSSDTFGTTSSMSKEAPPPSVRRAIGGSTHPIGGSTGPIGGSTGPIGGSTGPIGGSTGPIGGSTSAVGGSMTAIGEYTRAIGDSVSAHAQRSSDTFGTTSSMSTEAPPPSCATLYVNHSYTGAVRVVCQSRGSVDPRPYNPGLNNRISSVRLGPGVDRVVLYTLANWTGMRLVLDADAPHLGEKFDNAMSSFKVIPRVRAGCAIVFVDTHYRGRRKTVCENERFVGHEWTDAISSMAVARDTYVRVYAFHGYRRIWMLVTRNMPDLGFHGINDEISSISFE